MIILLTQKKQERSAYFFRNPRSPINEYGIVQARVEENIATIGVGMKYFIVFDVLLQPEECDFVTFSIDRLTSTA
jgi:hypothetical protein